jgi:hypothetical protein
MLVEQLLLNNWKRHSTYPAQPGQHDLSVGEALQRDNWHPCSGRDSRKKICGHTWHESPARKGAGSILIAFERGLGGQLQKICP